MSNQRQAKKGGEVGKNGEMYKGGQFIANTDHAKGQSKAKQLRKQEVAPYAWEVQPTENHRAIYSLVGGVWAKFNRDTNKLESSNSDTPANIMDIIESFNNGDKWCLYNQVTRSLEKLS